jgi:hypothetical protein
MKHLKMLGIAVMAVMTFGAGSASAASHLYSTGVQVAAGTELHASLENGTSSVASTTDGKTLATTCSSSTIAGKGEYPAGGDARVSISRLTWGGCTITTDTIANGVLNINSAGTVIGAGTTITKLWGGVTCRYTTGTGTHLGTLNTGRLSINAILLEEAPTSFICPDTIKWVANYTVTSPHDLSAGA